MPSLPERLNTLLSKMSIHLPFIAAVAMSMKSKVEKCGTAMTNGVWVKFDPDFCAKLSDAELMYLYAHETMHKALLHVWRRGTREGALWNMACDYVINNSLNDMRSGVLQMPKEGLSGKYKGMSEEQVYEQMKKDGVKPPPGYGSGDLVDDGERTLADAEIEIINIAKACKMAGISGSLVDLILDNAGKSQVKWQDVLRDFVTSNIRSGSTWRRRSRRSVDIYLPSLRSKVLGSIVVFGDVSGSMMAIVKEVINEMQGIIDDVSPEYTHVICGDTSVTFVQTFERGDKIKVTARGGGGTDFRPLFAKVDELDLKPDCGVFLTDTYGSFPDAPPDYPLIWGVIGAGRDVEVPWGEKIYVGKTP